MTPNGRKPIKSKGTWSQSSRAFPVPHCPLQTQKVPLIVTGGASCPYSCCQRAGSPVVCFSASLHPPTFLFHAKALLFQWLCREGRDSALLPMPSPRCGLQGPQPPPQSSFFLPGTELWPPGEVSSTRVVSY